MFFDTPEQESIILETSPPQEFNVLEISRGPQGIPGPVLVSSVNSKQGDVVLSSTDVGADPAGSANTALTESKAYTDTVANSINTSLSTVAKSGLYSDLEGKPALGTAASTNTELYATATQGTKADTAVQPAQIANFETTSQLHSRDTLNRDRANHTGTQPISTVQSLQTTLDAKADLENGKLVASQLPSYVDDVLEYTSVSQFPATGENGKIYIDTTTNLTYRWSGTGYAEISQSLALGETSSTAFAGDKGKQAYDHTSRTDNPHAVTKAQVGLGNVDNTSDLNKPVSTATQTALNAKANASDTVNLTGNQTIAGVKTFSSSPVVPTATTNTQAVTKGQMDTADALKVSKAGDTMTGRLTVQNPGNQDNYSEFYYTGSGSYSLLKYGNLRPPASNTVSTLMSMVLNSNNSTVKNGFLEYSTPNITAGAVDSQFKIVTQRGGGDLASIGDTLTTLYTGHSRFAMESTTGVSTIVGTGFPNGVVSAPVGSIYIDKNATNGASSWIKKSGAGNTGWQVLEGDTGQVSIAITAGGTGTVSLRRVGNVVAGRLNITATNAGITNGTVVLTLPSGYRPTTIVDGLYAQGGGNPSRLISVVSSGGIYLYGGPVGSTTATANFSFITADAYPAS